MNQDAAENGQNKKSFFVGHPLRTFVLVVLLGVCVFWAFHLARLSRAISANEEAIRQAGYPLTLEELNAWYEEPPEGQNAAGKVIEALDAYVSPEQAGMPELPILGEGELPPLGMPISDEMTGRLVKYLALNEKSLQLLYEASEMPRCRYPIDLTAILSSGYPHLQDFRLAVCLMSLNSLTLAETGDLDGAAKALAASIRLGQLLRDEPILVSQQMAVACVGTNLDIIESVVNRVSLTVPQLDAVSTALSCVDLRKPLARAFAGERCFFNDIRESSLPMEMLGLEQKDRLSILETYEQLIEATGQTTLQRKETEARLVAQAQATPFGYSRMLLPALARSLVTPIGCETRQHVALVALAVERFRVAHGNLPKSLDELASAGITVDIADPFDGGALHYVVTGSDFVVYSVGPDRKDDGGTPGRGERGDIVFTVRRAVAPAQ